MSRKQGVIIRWDDARGFGFIRSSQGQEYFVHTSAFSNRNSRPDNGMRVSFIVDLDKQGREQAIKVKNLDQSVSPALHAFVIAAVFLFVVVILGLFKVIPIVVSLFYILASAASFFLYLLDKSSARKGSWRTPENKLHMLSLLGGWPGALFAQQLLHHKSKKASFRRVFWLTVLVNIIGLLYLVSPYGEKIKVGLGQPLLQVSPQTEIYWSE